MAEENNPNNDKREACCRENLKVHWRLEHRDQLTTCVPKKKANRFCVLHPLTKLCYPKPLGIYFNGCYKIVEPGKKRKFKYKLH